MLVDAYAAGGDVTVVEPLGDSTQIFPAAKAPRVWLAISEGVFGLDWLAVRREALKVVRTLTTQLPAPLPQSGYERNWLRHALTMASRARHFAPTTEEPATDRADRFRSRRRQTACRPAVSRLE